MNVKLNSPEPAMTGARQTMLTWSRPVASFQEVPTLFQSACCPQLETIQPFPHTVYAPAIQNIRYPFTQKLLCVLNGNLYIWESVGGMIQTYIYPLENICHLEFGSILLNSWMKISGLTIEGAFLTTAVPFNTSTLRHYLPLIQRIRPAAAELDQKVWQTELSRFDTLAVENFKFMSFARESLVMGQKVIETIWQPAIQRHIITLFGHSFDSNVTLAHLAILTDSELILIRDDESSEENRGVRYGGVWHYIPILHIQSLSLSEPENDRLRLSVAFSNGSQPLELVFASRNTSALLQLQNQFASLKKK